MKIKKIKDWEEYDASTCIWSRCKLESVIILATKKFAPVDIGLCDEHWERYCDEMES